MKSLSSLLLVFILSFPLYSQSPVKFSGQIRPRVEVGKTDFHLNTNPASTIFLRSRLNAAYSPSDDLSVFLQIQDSRYMGQEKNTQGNLGNLDVKEAYFELKNIFGAPIDIKAGRMAVAYGNERLIGAADWGNYGRSFDGILGKFKNNFVKIDVFAFKESDQLIAKDSLDKGVLGLWSEIYLTESQTIQPFFVWSVENFISENSILGFNWIGKFGGFRAETEFAYQYNLYVYRWSNGESCFDEGEAYLGAINVYQGLGNFELSIGLDYVSGASSGKNSQHSFYSLYGTYHKFYGYMDYFPSTKSLKGLKDFHVRINYDMSEDTRLYFGAHRFLTEIDKGISEVQEPGYGYYLESSKDLGWEGDLVLNHKYSDYVSFQIGTAAFIPGEIFRDMYGDDIALWGYLMATVNF